MQKEKPPFEVIPNWRRYSRLFPANLESIQVAAVAVNQMARSALGKQTTLIATTAASAVEAAATIDAAAIDQIA